MRILNSAWKAFGYLSYVGGFLALTGLTPSVYAQDLKAISITLATQISASGRKTVAVVDFTDLEGNVTKLGRFLAEDLSVGLVGSARGFDVIDRTHLKVLLQEHHLSTTGLIDPQTARKLGQIAGADALVTGTTTPLGDAVRLYVKVLDTATAKTIAASTSDVPKTPAITALLNEPTPVSTITPNTASPNRPTSSPEVSVEQNSLVFAIKKCTRSGNTLSCFGYVRNKDNKRRVVNLVWGVPPAVVDDLGDQYAGRSEKVRFGSNNSYQELEPDLPVNFSFAIDDVNTAATRATVIFTGWIQNETQFKVALRNIPIESN